LIAEEDGLIPTVQCTAQEGAEEAGRQLKALAELSGLKPKSRVHGLGDGALRIAEQTDIQFGVQGSYLIDFYHLCNYCSAAFLIELLIIGNYGRGDACVALQIRVVAVFPRIFMVGFISSN
jgi:hypothetical protein